MSGSNDDLKLSFALFDEYQGGLHQLSQDNAMKDSIPGTPLGGGPLREASRNYHVPINNTAGATLVLEPA